MTKQSLTNRLSVNVSYINKDENGKLYFDDYPPEKLIHKLADAFDGDEDELPLLPG